MFLGQTIIETFSAKLLSDSSPLCYKYCADIIDILTLPHNLIKDKLIDLIERAFQREGSLYLASNDRNAFYTSEKPKKYHAWSCQNVCDALTFFVGQHFCSIWHQALKTSSWDSYGH